MTITADTTKLLTLDHVREVLAASEPLQVRRFVVGDQVRFDVRPGWEFGIDAKAGTEVVDAYITLGGGSGKARYRLTKDALLGAAVLCKKLPWGHVAHCPGELLTKMLNYWFRQGLAGGTPREREHQLLISAGVGAALAPSSSKPFSNVILLDAILEAIEGRYGAGEVMADNKFHHTLQSTIVRLVIPQHTRTLQRTGVDGDTWSAGIQLKNSLIARGKTRVDGYLYRWAGSAGAIDTHNKAGGTWTRRNRFRDDENDGVFDWTRTAVNGVLDGIDESFGAVQALVDVPIEGHVSDVLRDVFATYTVPMPERAKIIELLSEYDELTMYSVMAAIAQAANEVGAIRGPRDMWGPANEANAVESLMRLAGDLPHAATSVCAACRRLSHVH